MRAAWWLVLIVIACGSARAQDDVLAERPAAEVQSTVEQVLSQSEYRHLVRQEEAGPQDRELPEWYRKLLKWLFGDSEERSAAREPWFRLGDYLFPVAMTVLGVIVVLLPLGLWLRADTERSKSSQQKLSDEEAIQPTQPPGDIPANEYERRAMAAAQQEDYRTALRELVLGAMSWTERAGLIRYRLGLTNRDYVRANWRDPQRRESLIKIVAAFERVFYGRRHATAEMFAESLDAFRESFAREVADAQLAR